MTFKCYYHPDREASVKCEICGKLVCLECRMYLKKMQGTGNSRTVIRYEVCPLCYYNKMDKGYGKRAKLFALGFTIPLIIFIAISLILIDVPFIAIFGIATIAILWIYAFYYAPKKRVEFRKKREFFLQGLETYNSKKRELERRCTNCGAKVDPNASICSYCGEDLK
jgi:hypothetical protein